MPAFTVVENNELKRIIICLKSHLINHLGAPLNYMDGAWPATEFKIVDNDIVEKSQEEITLKTKSKTPDTIALVATLATDIVESGFAMQAALPHQSVWTKTDAKNAIDQAAGRARSRTVSQGNLIGEEYNQAARQVALWRANGSPLDNVPNMLKSRADSSAITLELAAQSIELAQLSYENLFEKTFDIRLKGKAAIDAATDSFTDVAAPFITQLNNL